MSVALVALAAGYLLGALPTAHLVAKARGMNVFEVGSGSMGAMNVTRNLGIATGLFVLVVDVSKGAAATYLGSLMARAEGLAGDPFALASLLPPLLAGLGAVAGHCFSAYVGFRGGQGLATAFGAALPLYPYPALYGLVLVVALVLMFRRSGPAVLATLGLYPVVTLLALDRRGWPREATFLVTTAVVAMSLVALARQLSNRRRRGGTRHTGASLGDRTISGP